MPAYRRYILHPNRENGIPVLHQPADNDASDYISQPTHTPSAILADHLAPGLDYQYQSGLLNNNFILSETSQMTLQAVGCASLFGLESIIMRLKRVAEAKLPTPWGDFLVVGFEEIITGHNHLALVYGDMTSLTPVLARVHSECLTGDALFSLRCDCGFQLEAALTHIAEEGLGILLYHRQEGRNIGLLNKIRAYALQDKGADTVEANYQLGFAADERDFTLCADMFKLLGVKTVRLLTNNPKKVEILTEAGISISERVPLIVGRNPKNARYLDTKATKMGHLLNGPSK